MRASPPIRANVRWTSSDASAPVTASYSRRLISIGVPGGATIADMDVMTNWSKVAIPALDALDFDDENSYNTPTTVAFGVMLGGLGYNVNPDPFTNNSYWINVVAQINAQLPGTVDGVHLQAYAGGAGNNPCVGWNFGSVPVWPGLWDLNDSPSQVQNIMSGWNNQCGINGGFMWLYDDFVGNGLAAQYAAAINAAVASEGSFTISGPSNVSITQGSTARALITITPLNGFDGAVTLSSVASPARSDSAHPGPGNVSTEDTLPGHSYRDHGVEACHDHRHFGQPYRDF